MNRRSTKLEALCPDRNQLTSIDHATPARPEIDRIATIAKALAHPARLKIVDFLLSREGCIAGDIVNEVGLAQSTVSEHLRILKATGLINGTIEHPRICYSLNADALQPLRALLDQITERSPPVEAACIVPDNTTSTASLQVPAAKE
ncbi:ArsR/SmtB family transcription factor [Aquicoccus sp.]|uniref:ArsR/SmtB family transcription factor n=1 Tax=Aquicoccus sp. TaxID=2055851 RepID=UPI003566560B